MIIDDIRLKKIDGFILFGDMINSYKLQIRIKND
jgi:hypothetical protein